MIALNRSIDKKADPLIKLNRKLDSACTPHLINEAFIAAFHSRMIRYTGPKDVYYWLTYARITEAALLCAGNYADNCEFSAAGDLLANPRCIDVYNLKSGEPAVKCRHGSMSGQFKPENMPERRFRDDFAAHFKMRISEPALLPRMYGILEHAGVFSEDYVASVNERMKKIADTIAFLSAWPVENRIELQERMASAPPDSKRFIEGHLCHFNPLAFEALGAELLALERKTSAVGARMTEDGELSGLPKERRRIAIRVCGREKIPPAHKTMPLNL